MKRAFAVAAALLVVGIAPSAEAAKVTVKRSAHGIPHIKARTLPALAYGYAQAIAQDNVCVLADTYVTVRGERSKFFGPDARLQLPRQRHERQQPRSDFFFRKIIAQGTVEKLIAQPPPHGPVPALKRAVRGYVAGYNACAGAGSDEVTDPRARASRGSGRSTSIDAYRRFYQLALLASAGVAIDGIGDAQPAGRPGRRARRAGAARCARGRRQARTRSSAASAPTPSRSASEGDRGRATACCSATRTSRGTAPSASTRRTSPSRASSTSQGGSLFGVPIILIGHTRKLAWSHTVSTACRFTPYRADARAGRPVRLPGRRRGREDDARRSVTVERRPDGQDRDPHALRHRAGGRC